MCDSVLPLILMDTSVNNFKSETSKYFKHVPSGIIYYDQSILWLDYPF